MSVSSLNNVELLAPAGSFAALKAGLEAGADSIYFGIGILNMRSVSAANFELEDLPKVMEIVRSYGKKAYLALNTVLYDHDMSFARRVIDLAVECQIDGIIVSDYAIIPYIAERGVPVHISTQLNVTNVETVAFHARYANTVVLSRELTLGQVEHVVREIKRKQILGPDGKLVRIEVFAHGALCMAISGKCYLSLHSHNASANRGACRQNCRKRYEVRDEDGNELLIDNEYIMSPKDLAILPFLDEVLQTGVQVLKLEGRGRSADYVAMVTRCYREAIDAYQAGTFTQEKVAAWEERLKTVYNRGFWGGYYLGRNLGEWTQGNAGSRATLRKIYVGKAEKYYPNIQVAQFKIETREIKKGDKMQLIGPEIGIAEFVMDAFRADNQVVEVAKKGQRITFTFNKAVGNNDKLYKLVSAESLNQPT